MLSAEARKYKNDVRLVNARVVPLKGTLQWKAIAYFPDRRGDLSNRIKILEDALNGVAWDDDSQVEAISIVRGLDKKNPRIEIEVTPWK